MLIKNNKGYADKKILSITLKKKNVNIIKKHFVKFYMKRDKIKHIMM